VRACRFDHIEDLAGAGGKRIASDIRSAEGEGGAAARIGWSERRELGEALDSAATEARPRSATTRCTWRNFIGRARHIEIQVLGDCARATSCISASATARRSATSEADRGGAVAGRRLRSARRLMTRPCGWLVS